MRSYNAVFAGEHSGHYYFADNYCADSGLIAALIVLYLLSRTDKSLSELAAPLRSSYVQLTETNFKVADKDAIIADLSDVFKDGEQDTLDGLTVTYATAWFNVRPSNTEPLLRLNAEAKSQKQLDDLVSKITSHITSIS